MPTLPSDAELYIIIVVLPAIVPVLLSWGYGVYRKYKGIEMPWLFSIIVTILMIISLLIGWFTRNIVEEKTLPIQWAVIALFTILILIFGKYWWQLFLLPYLAQ